MKKRFDHERHEDDVDEFFPTSRENPQEVEINSNSTMDETMYAALLSKIPTTTLPDPIQLPRIEYLEVKCAALELKITQMELDNQLREACEKHDQVIQPILDKYRGTFLGKIGVDLESGCVVYSWD